MANFPTIQLPDNITTRLYKPQLKTEFESNYILIRPKVSRTRHQFTLNWSFMKASDKGILESFFDTNQGTAFTWVNPLDSQSYTVVFGTDDLTFNFVGVGEYSIQFALEEI